LRYRYLERFLLQLSPAQADQALTEALARWTATMWQVYIGGHRKAVYTETFIPPDLIRRLGKIAGCRALMFLPDEQGHPLLVPIRCSDL
jgi:hypothetical protein